MCGKQEQVFRFMFFWCSLCHCSGCLFCQLHFFPTFNCLTRKPIERLRVKWQWLMCLFTCVFHFAKDPYRKWSEREIHNFPSLYIRNKALTAFDSLPNRVISISGIKVENRIKCMNNLLLPMRSHFPSQSTYAYVAWIFLSHTKQQLPTTNWQFE